jgi:hypothetical protein
MVCFRVFKFSCFRDNFFLIYPDWALIIIFGLRSLSRFIRFIAGWALGSRKTIYCVYIDGCDIS